MKTVDAASVRRLARRIERAVARGDSDVFARLVSQMVDVAAGPALTTASAASTAAFQWLADNDGGLLQQTVCLHFFRRPETLVEMVKSLRAFTRSPTASPKARREAQQALARYGYDDKSLRADG